MKTSASTSDGHSTREHSDLVGGSTAERRLMCPGSYKAEQKVPEVIRNRSSADADEGTALHEAVECFLREALDDPMELVGRTFNGHEITRTHVIEAIVPCIDFLDALEDELEIEGGVEFVLEKRCQLPGIPDAFGTSDYIGRTSKRSIIIDWKFGAGVPVKASYPEQAAVPGTGEVVIRDRPNSQLMFYARAAMHSEPQMFGEGDDWPVDLYIVQPRAYLNDDQFWSHYQTTRTELEAFRFKLIAAVAEAKGENPRTSRGDWCRFAACKTVCPHHLNPVLDLTKMHSALERKKTGAGAPDIDWTEMYADLLELADAAKLVTNEIIAQAHQFMEAGGHVRERKLVAKDARERYVDEAGAKRHVLGLGLDEAEIVDTSLKTPAQLSLLMEGKIEGATKKARVAEAREQLAQFTEKVSSGTKIVHEDDRREAVVPTIQQVSALTEKLKQAGVL